MRARYVVRFAGVDVAMGPVAEVLVRPLVVKVDAAEVFRLPVALLGLSVELGGAVAR